MRATGLLVWQRALLFISIAFLASMPSLARSSELPTDSPPGVLKLPEGKIRESEALAHYAWGLFLLFEHKERTEEVQQHFFEALKYNPRSHHIIEQAIGPWLAEQNYAAIADNISPLAKENPDAIPLQLLVAAAYRNIEQSDKAIPVIEHAFIEKRIRDPRLLRELARLYWENNAYRKLANLLAAAHGDAELRGHFTTYYVLAHFHNSMAAAPEGAKLSRRQITRHRKHALRFARHAKQYLESVEALSDIEGVAGVFEAFGHHREAIEFLSQGRKQHPQLRNIFEVRIAKNLAAVGEADQAISRLYGIDINEIHDPQLLLDIGRAFFEHHRYRMAIQTYRRILEMAPAASGVRLTIGYLHLRRQQPREAIQLFSEVQRLSPDEKVLLSRAYFMLDEINKAESLLDQAAENAKSRDKEDFFDTDYLLYRATIFEESGQTGEAIETARQAFEEAPDNAIVTNFLGYVLADNNLELEEAEALIKHAVEQDPGNIAYLDSLAWVYYRQGRYRESLEQITKAMRQPDYYEDPVILDHAGDIYAANGLPGIARRYWWEALRQSPKNAAEIRAKLDD